MTTINTAGRFVGDWPRIGDPPGDRRPPARRARVARGADQGMALRAAGLISRRTCATRTARRSRSSIADHNIGGVSEAARPREKFRKEGVGVSLTVTPCWCYGSETMDMDPLMPKAVWGFNGTERPGRGLPRRGARRRTPRRACRPSASTGATCRTRATARSPRTCRRSCCGSRGPGWPWRIMRGKSYLSLGGVSMGIAGSIVDQPFFEKYLGHARRVRRHDRVRPPRSRRRSTTRPSSSARSPGSKTNCRRAQDRNRPRSRRAARRRTGSGRPSSR